MTSLAVVYPGLDRPNKDFGGRLVRLNIGLEAVNDLINDLDEAISTIRL
ncbi:PLP-dependent transferase [Amylibacter sp.]|nr:PLP-dependent transferase [Amylibacter sp.]